MTTQQTLDAAALKKKYQEEKNKRLENGNRTSLDPVGQFHEFEQDPFAGPAPERDAFVKMLTYWSRAAEWAGCSQRYLLKNTASPISV